MERRGCEKETDRKLWDIPGVGEIRRCPIKLVTAEAAEAMEARRWAKDGFLPAAGGWADQSATFCEAMEVLDRTINRHHAEAARAAEEERKRKARR